jgi:hypothetical protein
LIVQQQQLGVLLQMLERLSGRPAGPAPIPPITRWVPPAASPTSRGIPNLPIVRPPIIKVPAPIPPRGAAGASAADGVDISDPAQNLAGAAIGANKSINAGMKYTAAALNTATSALGTLSDVAAQATSEIAETQNNLEELDRRTGQLLKRPGRN